MNNLKEKVIRNSKIVNSWRSKVFTQKGKKIGFPETWKTYEGFYNEVGKDYKDGYILRRIDNTKGHTKENCVPCCIECNIARGNNFTYEEMKRLGKTIKEIKTLRNERDNTKRIA